MTIITSSNKTRADGRALYTFPWRSATLTRAIRAACRLVHRTQGCGMDEVTLDQVAALPYGLLNKSIGPAGTAQLERAFEQLGLTLGVLTETETPHRQAGKLSRDIRATLTDRQASWYGLSIEDRNEARSATGGLNAESVESNLDRDCWLPDAFPRRSDELDSALASAMRAMRNPLLPSDPVEEISLGRFTSWSPKGLRRRDVKDVEIALVGEALNEIRLSLCTASREVPWRTPIGEVLGYVGDGDVLKALWAIALASRPRDPQAVTLMNVCASAKDHAQIVMDGWPDLTGEQISRVDAEGLVGDINSYLKEVGFSLSRDRVPMRTELTVKPGPTLNL